MWEAQKEFLCKTSKVLFHLAYRVISSYRKEQNNAEVISTCEARTVWAQDNCQLLMIRKAILTQTKFSKFCKADCRLLFQNL